MHMVSNTISVIKYDSKFGEHGQEYGQEADMIFIIIYDLYKYFMKIKLIHTCRLLNIEEITFKCGSLFEF